MSEKVGQNPEASKQTIVDLYGQAAHYLETVLGAGFAIIEPAQTPHHVKVSHDVPTLNNKSLHLEYERPSKSDSPTEVDEDIPIAYTDKTGKNHWCTPISIKVYDETGNLRHQYDVISTGNPDTAIAYDREPEEDPGNDNPATITALDAHEIMAHLDWALDPQDQS